LRYRQTVLGGAWAIFQPAIAAAAFTFIFRDMVGSTYGVPYRVFAYAGTLIWLLFSSFVGESSVSMLNSTQLVTKVYFPRVLLPLSVVGFTVLDFTLGLVILVGLIFVYGLDLGIAILMVPVVIVGVFMCAAGVSLFLSALTVKCRDFKFVIPFFLQIWFFTTPVIYPRSSLPEVVQNAIMFNPMAGWVELFRFCFFATPLDGHTMAATALLTTCLAIAGLIFFRQVETDFADVI
jgi:lipopolysaccharide transport system permease protein